MRIAALLMMVLLSILMGCEDPAAPPTVFPLPVVEQAQLHGADLDSITVAWHLDGATGSEEYCVYLLRTEFELEPFSMTEAAVDTIYLSGTSLEYHYTDGVILDELDPVTQQYNYMRTYFQVAVMMGGLAGQPGPRKPISP